MAKQLGGLWLSSFLVAAGILLLACCFCGSIGGWLAYKLTVPPNIVGRWESEFGAAVYEFRSDGTGQFQPKGDRVYPFRYEFVSFSELILRFPPPARDAEPRMEELRYEVSYFHHEMQWEDMNRRGFYTKLRRLR
jgi:hypothetical protein